MDKEWMKTKEAEYEAMAQTEKAHLVAKINSAVFYLTKTSRLLYLC